jgi:hypothetical protein
MEYADWFFLLLAVALNNGRKYCCIVRSTAELALPPKYQINQLIEVWCSGGVR